MQADPSRDKDFSFARLNDLKAPVTVRIISLEGKVHRKSLTEILADPELRHTGHQNAELADLYVSCQLWADGKETTLPFRTPWKDFTRTYKWNQTIVLPITYPSLLLSSQIAFTIWDVQGAGRAIPIGGTTMTLFNSKRTLKRGQQRLFVHRNVEADPRPNSSTPSEVELGGKDEMGRLEALVKDYDRGDITKIDWLDRMVFRQIEKVHAEEEDKSDHLFLYVGLPKFDFPVVFTEQENPVPMPPLPKVVAQAQGGQNVSALPPDMLANDAHLWRTYDPDAWREEHPLQIKQKKLARSERLSEEGKDLKPDPSERDRLQEIFRSPPTVKLNAQDQDLLWKYRYSHFRSPGSLTKFLKCVTWDDPQEAKQAVEKLLPLWGTDIGMDDALELLGPNFRDRRVRAFAVKRLGRADNEEIQLYLLQLVQALKFESPFSAADSSRSGRSSRHKRKMSVGDGEDSGLSQLLIDRAAADPVLGTAFHWYLMIEVNNRTTAGKMYAKVAYRFQEKLQESTTGKAQREVLRRQAELVQLLSMRAKEIRGGKEVRTKKIENLRTYIADHKHGLSPLPAALPLPIDATISVSSINADKSLVFKSSLNPLLIWFETADVNRSNDEEGADTGDAVIVHDSGYPVIFKSGDDLRQDQLVIQLFMLMDRLLKREHVDLRISPYRVLATNTTEGMIQFVESKTLAEIMRNHANLQTYLRSQKADESALGTYQIDAQVFENFVRSCAGYSVLTYVLGVGDRHLDNLMLTPDGHFFHVDFGFILGRDPKPYPPQIKVSKEMVDAMGGIGSKHYERFQALATSAFMNLRKNANLILTLIALMVDAGIQDIQLEPDKAVWKVEEKFMLDRSEEDAMKQFQILLNDQKYITMVFDKLHDWAQFLRD